MATPINLAVKWPTGRVVNVVVDVHEQASAGDSFGPPPPSRAAVMSLADVLSLPDLHAFLRRVTRGSGTVHIDALDYDVDAMLSLLDRPNPPDVDPVPVDLPEEQAHG